MDKYVKKVDIRWSDLDPNFHLRHSIYYDWGAFVRMGFLTEHGVTTQLMMQHHIGPIIFREETVFKREIVFNDVVELTLSLSKCTRNMGRWTMTHEVIKNKETLCAIITVDGAWLDTEKRKLALPPQEFVQSFNAIPKPENFVWID